MAPIKWPQRGPKEIDWDCELKVCLFQTVDINVVSPEKPPKYLVN